MFLPQRGGFSPGWAPQESEQTAVEAEGLGEAGGSVWRAVQAEAVPVGRGAAWKGWAAAGCTDLTY